MIRRRLGRHLLCGVLALGVLAACSDSGPPATPATPPLAQELVFYSWPDNLPHSVAEAFRKEYGVEVTSAAYQSPEEAVEAVRAGQPYDIAVIDHDYIPGLVAENRLAEIDLRNIPNFRNISPNFRDLATDPGNRHTVPYQYGTTGLLVRTDLIGSALTRWADLWDPRYSGRIALRAQPRELLAFTLLSLGYPLNSESPEQIEAALSRLLELKPSIVLLETESDSAVPKLLSGEVAVLHGWTEDFQAARQANPAVSYVSPQEGNAIWGDNLVILASSPRKYTAEVFLNFLLRPEIGAQIVNENSNATANEAALPFVLPEIRNDPVIFPPVEILRRAQHYSPLSPEGETRYQRAWDRFLAGGSGAEQR